MGEDLSAIARVIITLILVGSIVTIVFTLIRTLRTSANSSSKQFLNQMDQLVNSKFDTYNNQPLSGRDVVIAIQTFQSDNIAIVVKTSAYSKGFCYGALLSTASKDTSANINTLDGDVYTVVLNDAGTTGLYRGTENGIKNGYWTGNLSSDVGGGSYNSNTKPITRSSYDAYIRESASYYAELIRDNTDEIIGIVFTQQ